MPSGSWLGKTDLNFDDDTACKVQHCQHNIQDTRRHMRRRAAEHAQVPRRALFPRFVTWKVRRRGGIEPLHVSMPCELKSRPSTSLTHPGNSNLQVQMSTHAFASFNSIREGMTLQRHFLHPVARQRKSLRFCCARNFELSILWKYKRIFERHADNLATGLTNSVG